MSPDHFLRPCPDCGSKANINYSDVSVDCSNIDCDMQEASSAMLDECIRRWNNLPRDQATKN